MSTDQWELRTKERENGMSMPPSSTTWEEETIARLRNAKNQLAVAEQQKREAEEALSKLGGYIQALETVLEMDRQSRGIKINGSGRVDPEVLRSKSIREALIEIAARQHGLLAATDALDILTTAGVYKTRAEARNSVYSTLKRSKEFIKERRGVYRLSSQAQAAPRRQGGAHVPVVSRQAARMRGVND
jgi:hypothetical protein